MRFMTRDSLSLFLHAQQLRYQNFPKDVNIEMDAILSIECLMSRNLINFSDLSKKDIFDLIELANNFKSEDSLDYRDEKFIS